MILSNVLVTDFWRSKMFEGIAMCVALLGMGIYFVKSTDLPKDMKDRSAQFRANTPVMTNAPAKKYSFPVVSDVNSSTQQISVQRDIQRDIQRDLQTSQVSLEVMAQEKLLQEKLLQEKLQLDEAKLQAKIALHNQKIDQITLLITTLEQQLKDNHERNALIQNQINLHLETLQTLRLTKIS